MKQVWVVYIISDNNIKTPVAWSEKQSDALRFANSSSCDTYIKKCSINELKDIFV
jgi:hypothetical protein